MKVIAKIDQLLPAVEGSSERGPWKKQVIIFRNIDRDNRFMVTFFGVEKCEYLKMMKPGMLVEVSFELTCREYNGSFFPDVRGFDVTILERQSPTLDNVPVNQPSVSMPEGENPFHQPEAATNPIVD